jgi:hypothetical protein
MQIKIYVYNQEKKDIYNKEGQSLDYIKLMI